MINKVFLIMYIEINKIKIKILDQLVMEIWIQKLIIIKINIIQIINKINSNINNNNLQLILF